MAAAPRCSAQQALSAQGEGLCPSVAGNKPYFQKLTGELCLAMLTSGETTPRRGEDEGPAPADPRYLRVSGSPVLLLLPRRQSGNNDEGAFKFANTATVVRAQTTVPVLKKLERGQPAGCRNQAGLCRGYEACRKVRGRLGELRQQETPRPPPPRGALCPLPAPPRTSQTPAQAAER